MPTYFTQQPINLANITGFATNMQIMYEIECTIAGKSDGVSHMVRSAVKNKIPSTEIIRTLKDMATDNFKAITDILGTTLTLKIKDYVL